jgi:hypothetical protein
LRGSLITLMMEAVRASETLVNIFLTTWQYIPEDSKLHTRILVGEPFQYKPDSGFLYLTHFQVFFL